MVLTKETRVEIVEFLEKVEQSGKWPQQACTTMFFLIPKNVTSERPIALMPTLTPWWEALRASEVAKWQQKYRVDWDAIHGRNEGATNSLGKSDGDGEVQIPSSGRRSGSSGLGVGPGERPRADQSSCGDALQLPKEDLASVVRVYFEHQKRVQFEGCVAEPLRTSTAILPGSKWSCLLLRTVLQDALREVTNIYLPLKFEGLCG